MGIEYTPDGKTRIKHPYRRADGRATWKQVTVDSQDKRVVAKAMLDLVNACDGSLTDKTWSTLSADYQSVRGDQGMAWYYGKLETEFGRRKIGRRFIQHYERFIQRLRGDGLAPNTIANMKSVIMRVLNHAYRHGKISDVPIKDWNIERTYRQRVWVGDERLRFYNKMQSVDSPIYWSVRFAEERPVRGRSDLWNLTDENLILFGPGAPYIRYRPEKTRRERQEYTYLPLIDISPDILDYLTRCRPKGCPYLFPSVGTERNANVTKLAPGEWRKIGYPIKHWRWLCTKAGIHDFRFHDLKHVAITHMISTLGYTVERLKELGIQYSEQSVNVYWCRDAFSALESIASCSKNVAALEVKDGTCL